MNERSNVALVIAITSAITEERSLLEVESGCEFAVFGGDLADDVRWRSIATDRAKGGCDRAFVEPEGLVVADGSDQLTEAWRARASRRRGFENEHGDVLLVRKAANDPTNSVETL